jgi:CheY-like chemotaxis protein
MPRLGGDGLCALLRGREQTRQIPIVLMSAVTSSAAAEYSAFLSKPFDLDEMLGIIRNCLSLGPLAPQDDVAARQTGA